MSRDDVHDLRRRKEHILGLGGTDRVQRQHDAGKMTARERLDRLLDPGSFTELDMFVTHHTREFGMDKVDAPADGVVTGYGTIDGRPVCVFSQDFTVLGRRGVKRATRGEEGLEGLGGARVHVPRRGVAPFVADDDPGCRALLRRVLSYLPQNNREQPPVIASDDDPNRMDADLDGIVPEDRTRPYDMAEVITRIVDRETFLEVHAQFARNLITGFARLGGRSVGVVAQQPRVLAGALDLNASAKGARFIRCCDAFNIPLVTFVDVPGFLPGLH